MFQEDPTNRNYVLPIDNEYIEAGGSWASAELATDGEVNSFSHFLGLSLVHAIS